MDLDQLSISWWPYFDLVHCIICCLTIHDKFGDGALLLSRKHPLAIYLLCMLDIFAGVLICNALLGEAVLGALKDQQYVLMATIVLGSHSLSHSE